MTKSLKFSLFALTMVSPTVFAIEPGLGVSFKSNDINIYLPINVSKSFRVEPFIGQYKTNETEDLNKASYTQKEIGLGAFGLHQSTENIGVYYGARIARVESRRAYSTQYSYEYDTFSSANKSSDEQSGYSFAPVLGFEYSVVPQLSVGGEASWELVDMDGKDKSSYNTGYSVTEQSTKTETTQNNTITRLMIRYYF